MEKREDGGAGARSRTELVWPGKYAEGGALLDVPREAGILETSELWDPSLWAGEGRGKRDPAPPNLLIHGDNLRVMDTIGEELAEKVDLVYIDPPFATGAEFQHFSRIGEGDTASRKIRAQPSVRDRAYDDSWGQDPGAYLAMLAPRLRRIRSLLAPAGSLFVHLDRRAAHPVKLLLDEIFGRERCVNEIIWCYTGPSSPRMRSFANKHDVIFWYAKGDRWTFNVDAVRLPYKESTRRNEGRRTGFTTGDPNLVVRLNPLGKYPEDWWVLPVEAPASRVRTGYPTQKPERLLERVLLAATREGDLVADLFSGSGTTLAVAERLGRRWIGCDASRLAVETAKRRLLDLPTVRPFEVRVLRSGIRSGTRSVARRAPAPAGASDGPEGEGRRILEAYGRTVEGAPKIVLLDDNGEGAVESLEALEGALVSLPPGGALHALRPRWEWRLLEAARRIARERGVGLIPVEVSLREGNGAPASGARRPSLRLFREVPEVRAEVRFDERGRAVVALVDLVRLAPGLLPPEVSAHARGWPDLVDAWAVDWDWREGPIRPGFVTYRTVKRRSLALESPPHAFEGLYRAVEGGAPPAILTQVRDVLGVEAYLRLEVAPQVSRLRT